MLSPSITLLRTQSDDRLAALAREGHERAFEAIVERYRRPLLRHGRRLLPEARAEEAVQQAFMAAWAALQRGDEVRHLGAWLHRIVHNAALNALRGERDGYAELRDWLQGDGAPEDELERRELLRRTLTNLAALPERQREALLRIAVDGHSAEEVGTALGLSEGAVRQLVYRARIALRAAMTSLTPLPLASWLARSDAPLAELVGGAGTAGLGSVLAKTGVVVVVAGSAAAVPALLEQPPPGAARAQGTSSEAKPRVERPPGGDVPVVALPSTPVDDRGDESPSSDTDSSGPGSGGSGSGGSDSSGSGSDGSDSSGSGSDGSDSSGSGSDGSDSSGSGSSGSGSSVLDSGGSGSSLADSSGSGSGDSGSGLSGSSGSGSTESDSSGSGSTGSGSSDSGASSSSGS